MIQHRPRRSRDQQFDPRFWRTELLAPGPYRDPPEHWTLWIDGHFVAATSGSLTNGQAHDWARREMGEGVRFEPVMFDDTAEGSLREGQAIDWCANPMPGSWRPARVGGGE